MEHDGSLPHSQVSHLHLSWARSLHSMTPNNFFKISFNVIHLRPGLSSGLLPSAFPTKILCPPLLSAIHAKFPVQPILLALINRKIFGEEYRSWSSSLCSLSHSPITSSPWGTNDFLRILHVFPNKLILRPSLKVGDPASHPYKTTGKIIVLHILVFIFLESKLEDKKILHRGAASTPWVQSAQFHPY